MIAFEDTPDGVTLRVRVSPGASRDRILGEHDAALKVSVSAAPEKGKANKAVCALIARKLGIAKSQVSVVAGETSRDKRLLVRGIDGDTIRQALAATQ